MAVAVAAAVVDLEAGLVVALVAAEAEVEVSVEAEAEGLVVAAVEVLAVGVAALVAAAEIWDQAGSVAAAVVGQRDTFRRRIMRPADRLRHLTAISVDAVLVDVVAKVHDGVDIGFLGEGRIGVEESELPVRAGDDDQPDRRVAGDRRGARTPGRGGNLTGARQGLEAVGVSRCGLQARRICLDAVVVRRVGAQHA